MYSPISNKQPRNQSVSLGGTCRRETEARGTRKALGGKTGGDGVPGERLAHPCPPEPRVDATGMGGEKKATCSIRHHWGQVASAG